MSSIAQPALAAGDPMQFDDRLATVLRMPVRGEADARTQYRQLLDLLGSVIGTQDGEWTAPAYERLAALAAELPANVQAKILRSLDLRLRSRPLAAWLGRAEPQVAAAAMATARLSEADWLELIPQLPVTARGFLRHRRDLPARVSQLLARLGVSDLVLPVREGLTSSVSPDPTRLEIPAEEPGIGALVRRIEAFQRARKASPAPPPLAREPPPGAVPTSFDFESDQQGTVVWADPEIAPRVVGLCLASTRPGGMAVLDQAAMRAWSRRVPLAAARVRLDLAEPLSGEWRMEAAPVFSAGTGAFAGYRGRLSRPAAASPTSTVPSDSASDRMRQVLHELRTPVNAIQGFAEIIQQQLFGPAPHDYRALAGAVAVDAARLLAGFEDLDRLARLESDASELETGTSDLRPIVGDLLRRLEGVLRPRSARIDLNVSGANFLIGLERDDAFRLAWRLLATLAGAMGPGEVLDLVLAGDGTTVDLRAELPVALLEQSDVFAAGSPTQARALTAGMFGSGFAFRLTRAEATAAGGRLQRTDDTIVLTLPALTAFEHGHTVSASS